MLVHVGYECWFMNNLLGYSIRLIPGPDFEKIKIIDSEISMLFISILIQRT